MYSALAQAKLFNEIPQAGRSALARQGQQRLFQAGQALVRQGEVSDSSYLIVRGRVRVEQSHWALSEPVVLGELGPGDVVGHAGLLDGEPFQATFTAIEETEALELSAATLAGALLLLLDRSDAYLRILSLRLKSRDEVVQTLASRGWTPAGHQNGNPATRQPGDGGTA